MKRGLILAVLGCAVAALLAAGVLLFSGANEHADRGDRPPAAASRDQVGRGGERPARLSGQASEARPAAPEDGLAAVPAELVRKQVAELKDTSRPLAEREELVAGLGRKGDAASVAVLMAMGDERAYLNAEAVKALGSVRSGALAPRIREYLSARLAGDDSKLACEAARSLARIKGAGAVPELAAALVGNRERADGHQEIVCSAIVKALEEICSPAAVPALTAELARSEEKGWSLEYGSKIVHALRQIRAPAGDAAAVAYAGRLEARMPADPLARAYYAEKIAEARAVAGAGKGTDPSPRP